EGLVLLDFMLSGYEVGLLCFGAGDGRLLCRLGKAQPAEGARIRNWHVDTSGTRLALLCHEIRLGMIQGRLVIIRIECKQKCSGFDVLVVLHLRIDIENRAANASADRV